MYMRILILVTVIISLTLLIAIGWQQSSKQAQQAYDRGYDEGAVLIISQLEKGENIAYVTRDGRHRYDVEVFNKVSQWIEHETDPVCSICHTYSTDYYPRKEV